MTRTTKIILAIGITVIVIALGAGAIWYFLGGGAASTSPFRPSLFFPGGGDLGGGGSDAGAGKGEPTGETPNETKLLQIVKEAVIGPALSQDESRVFYYKRAGGNLFRAGLDGQGEENVSNLTILGIIDVAWSEDREQTIVSYAEDGGLKRFIQTVATATTSFLPQSVTNPRWSKDAANRIVYTELAPAGSRVISADSRGKNPRALYTNQIPDFSATWADASTIILTTPPSYVVPSISLLLPIGNPATNFISERGLGILPNKAGTIFALSGVDNGGRLLPLRFINRKGEVVAPTSVSTFIEKCAWDTAGETLYCAVPTNAGALLPDNWYQGKTEFNDRFVKIDSRTGNASDISSPGGAFDATSLFADSKGQYLFFTNKTDSTLWRLELGNG
ncbi:MAG: hypothetical protein HYT40_00425 [Candidatus Sungbacteria bacterium]|uniref:Uncharacterized protein n=1 Tax=Candidatus Sungiibacteriota bacterium TaxID=2750080 RepID=A0A931SDC1_9BACT|nr:hypothetical protein [Candidatus Sungbacteria bacterium]